MKRGTAMPRKRTKPAEPQEVLIPRGVQEALREIPSELVRAGLGLRYEVVTPAEEAALLREIDGRPWSSELSRRTQHYGYRFEYETKTCIVAKEEIPKLVWDLVGRRHFDSPEGVQCTINEYLPGQGIAPHVDTHSAFSDNVVALSLGSGVALRMKQRKETFVIWLPERSLLAYTGEARYAWTHGIVARKGDLIDGQWLCRRRRVSITLRAIATTTCQCAFPEFCDARGAPKFLPTRLKQQRSSPPDEEELTS